MRVSSNRRPRGGRPNSGNGRSGNPTGGRGGQNNNNNNRRSGNGNRSYDSNGPDGKIRGSATQVYDKYISLGRDAQTSGDHVDAENYYQHAEHYYRIMLANNLVKPDRPADQGVQEDENAGAADGGIPQSTASEKTPDVSANEEKPVKEPIIIDLSNPEPDEPEVSVSVEKEVSAPEVTPSAPEVTPSEVSVGDEAVESKGSDSDSENGEPKPKSKRRVSRTRGLRRRTSRRNSEDSDSDEPQSAE